MDTSANVGDISLADVDSIDTPPRVTPSPSLLQQTAPASTKQKARNNNTLNNYNDNMEDIFGSQASLAASGKGRLSPTQKDHRSQTEHPSEGGREGSGNSTTTTATASITTNTQSAIGTAVRMRVPSKENLYSHRSSSQKCKKEQRTHTAPHAEQSTYSSSLPSLFRTDAALAANIATTPLPAHESTLSLAEQYGGHLLHQRPAASDAVDTNSTAHHATKHLIEQKNANLECDPAIITDTLVQRMQSKEKEFDEKIHIIHRTFQNAGEQLVVRDSIIAQLQDELAQLRTEASRVPNEYQAREEKLLQLVDEMMTELHEEQSRTKYRFHTADEEVKQLRASLKAADQQLARQQRVSDDLLRQLRASDKALQDAKVQHAATLQDNRQLYEDKLMEFQRAYSTLEKKLSKSHARAEEVERDRAECQARLLEYELDTRRRHSSDSLRAKELALENEALREEVEAVQLSIARLLRLMSEVPALANYLQWNELSSEFVFLGYPTRYFSNGNNSSGIERNRKVSPSHRGQSPARSQHTESRQTSPARRRQQRCGPAAENSGVGCASPSFSAADRSDGTERSGLHLSPTSSFSGAPYYQDVNFSGVFPAGTGVEDGVYAGIASTLSKNVWLNGRWAQQMMDIITAENNFTRLKRIKLLELEEVAQLSEQLPSSRDVLESRRPEHDYWIPYAVFTEAQKFKNKYYPKLPATSHFYPFLIQLNKIWRAKLQDRLRVREADQQRSVSRQRTSSSSPRAAIMANPRHPSRQRRTRAPTTDVEDGSQLTSRSITASQLGALRNEELLNQLVQCEARAGEIREEHHRLRRDVRLHVSSQRALQLFRAYDELVRSAHQNLEEVIHLADELYGGVSNNIVDASQQKQQQADICTESHKQAAMDVLMHAQLTADVAEAVNARDRLLCVVKRTCERICNVGDSLSTRMLSYYSDLHQLIHILHRHIREHRTEGPPGAEKLSLSSSSDDSNRGGAGMAKESKERGNSAEMKRRLRRALRRQYETTEDAQLTNAAAASPSPPFNSISVDSLLKLAASVLDFGDEVRKEVTDASAALRSIAEQTMSEAEQLHADS